jgi:MFS superfamily sulfate permease-like transporter
MHSGPRTKYDRELIAQGIGNTLCGFCGALPMTGVIVRSAANVDAGAKTRASTIMHGAWLLLIVSLFPSLLKLIPTAALAAILVFTGYSLVVKVKEIREIWKAGRFEFAIYLITIVCIVCFDLLTGVIAGIVLSALKLLWMFTHLEIRLVEEIEAKRTTMYLEGAATFVRIPYLIEKLSQVPPNTELIVNMDKLTFIDHGCRMEFSHWAEKHRAQGGHVVVDWDMVESRVRRPQSMNPDNGDAVRSQSRVESTSKAD